MMAKFEKEIINVVCRDISYQGYGVAVSSDNRIFFVKGLFPGEEASIETTFKRNGQVFGVIKKLTKLSDKRIDGRCDTCTSCGGCQFQKLDYEEQLSFKKRMVKEQFNKIAKLEIEPLPTIGMNEPYYYRNKIQPKIGVDRYNRPITGFYKENSHKLVGINECVIEDKRATVLLSKIKQIFKELEIPVYNEFKKKGILRNILIRTSTHYDEVMLVLIVTKKDFINKDLLIKNIKKECTEVTSFYMNINNKNTSVILGNETIHVDGTKHINDTLCGIKFEISPVSFFQVNARMTEILYQKAMEFAKLTKNDVVFDAYSGIGSIGLVASKYCKDVIAVEVVKDAVKNANNNAKINKINNFKAYCGDATKFMHEAASKHEKIDVVFIDPPRKGSTEECLKSIVELKPRTIVYISCNPSTLARDVKYLSKYYDFDKVQPVDMFPMTAHVETVCSLNIKK